MATMPSMKSSLLFKAQSRQLRMMGQNAAGKALSASVTGSVISPYVLYGIRSSAVIISRGTYIQG